MKHLFKIIFLLFPGIAIAQASSGLPANGVNGSPTVIPYYPAVPSTNTIIGNGAGNASTTSTQNLIIGNGAGAAITSNGVGFQQDTILGYNACPVLTNAYQSTCIGANAGQHFVGNGLGNENGLSMFIGPYAGATFPGTGTSDTDLIAIGQRAFEQASTGSGFSVGIGNHVGQNVTPIVGSVWVAPFAGNVTSSNGSSSTNDVVIGYGLVSNITGAMNNNVLMGFTVANDQLAPSNDVFIGSQVASSGAASTSTTGGTCVGFKACNQVQNASTPNAFGYQALQSLTTGNANSAFGAGALGALTVGANNTAVGNGALQSLAGVFGSTSGNTAIGENAATALTGATSGIYIGAGAVGTNSAGSEIVIGAGTTGFGSNTTTIGTSSTTKSYLFGSVLSDGANPEFTWYTPTNGADQKYWDAQVIGSALYFRAISDNTLSDTKYMIVNRGSGYTITSVDFTGAGLVKLPTVSFSSQGAIASATTIAPTAQFFHVTGTTTIQTITAPTFCTAASTMCQITIIPDGIFATNTSGNIALATTATVVSKALIMTYDPATSKWYPSY